MPGNDWETSPLTAAELAQVVAIDRAITGRDRGGFYLRRLERTLAAPERYVHVGLRRGGALQGFALARLRDGEFGEASRSAALDAIGIHPDHSGTGGGRALLAEMVAVLRQKGVNVLVTEVDWEARGLLDFLARSGFTPAGSLVVERAIDGAAAL